MDYAAPGRERVCGTAGGRADNHAVPHRFGQEAPVDEDVDDREVWVCASVEEDLVEGVDVVYRRG